MADKSLNAKRLNIEEASLFAMSGKGKNQDQVLEAIKTKFPELHAAISNEKENGTDGQWKIHNLIHNGNFDTEINKSGITINNKDLFTTNASDGERLRLQALLVSAVEEKIFQQPHKHEKSYMQTLAEVSPLLSAKAIAATSVEYLSSYIQQIAEGKFDTNAKTFSSYREVPTTTLMGEVYKHQDNPRDTEAGRLVSNLLIKQWNEDKEETKTKKQADEVQALEANLTKYAQDMQNQKPGSETPKEIGDIMKQQTQQRILTQEEHFQWHIDHPDVAHPPTHGNWVPEPPDSPQM